MQLIIECETNTEIRNINMAVINSENINEKFSSDSLLEKYSKIDSPINTQNDANKTDDPKMNTLENCTDVKINVLNDTTKENFISEREGSLNQTPENKKLNNITKCLTEHPITEKTDEHTLNDISDDNSLLQDESSQDKGKTETESNCVENLCEIKTTIQERQDVNVSSNGDEKENESGRNNTSSPICDNEESHVCNEKDLELAKDSSDSIKVDEDQESNAALAETNIEESPILEIGVSNVETLELSKELSNDQKSVIESESCLDDKEHPSDMTLRNSETESLHNKIIDQDQTKHEEVNIIDKIDIIVNGSNVAISSKKENSAINEDDKLLMITNNSNSVLTTQVTDKNDIDTIEINDDASQDDVNAKITEKISNINSIGFSIETRDDNNSKVDNITPINQNSIKNERTNDCETDLPLLDEEVKPDVVSVKTKDSTREVSDVKHGEDKSLNNNVPCNSLTEKSKEKQLSFSCKLSNTLDFLSDDEDSSVNNRSNYDLKTTKQSIDLGDDDILLIDDEKISKESKNVTNVIPTSDTEEIIENKKEQTDDKVEVESNTIPEDVKGSTDIVEKIGTEDITEKVDNKIKNPPPTKPLVPTNFLSMCKKNVSEMTRNDLEEFCLLKIVESVVDKGNIGDIKIKINKMTLSLDEHKNKIKSLTKQNQDLQVVLRSVQEELRKNSPITPLKITRSVGIQVVKGEMSKQKAVLQQNITSSPAKSNRPPSAVNKAKRHVSPIQQNIPVPRLIPAKNSTNNVQNQTPNNKVALNTLSSTTTRATVQKPEKRSYTKSNPGSDTVDLTDDEPPNKIIPKPINQTVRVVSPQNLMPPQRAQMVNSPRKVYIPIGGGVQVPSIRPPTQTYMIKSLPTQNFRQRVPTLKRLHPAPLPESGKQYQAPNWKGIPPAPEIKLSKVENGIVISWKLDNFREDVHEDIASYQIYAYQETPSSPNTNLWKKIGDVKALPLPMACTLTQFVPGYKYYFAVRAVDIRSRQGNFSNPGNILLLNK